MDKEAVETVVMDGYVVGEVPSDQVINYNLVPLKEFEWSGCSLAQFELEMEVKQNRGTWLTNLTFPDTLEGTYSTWGVDEETARMLTGLVIGLKPQVILETGTHRGRGTKALYDGVTHNGQGEIHTIDIEDHGAAELFEGCGCVHVHQGKLPDDFRRIMKDQKGKIDFALLDASHSYSGVKAELECMREYGAEKWVALVDNAQDTSWPGIMPAVKDFCLERGASYISLPTLYGMAMVQMD